MSSSTVDLALAETDPAGFVLAVAELREQRARAATPGPYVAKTTDEGREVAHQIHAGPTGAVWLYIGADAQELADAEHIAAEANPDHALAAVRRWRGGAHRHRPMPDDPRICNNGCPGRYPCDDLAEVADEALVYMGGAA